MSALVPSEPIGVVTLFGIWGAGAVCAPLNPRLPEPELERLIADVRPAAVVKPSNEPGSLRAQVLSRAGEPRAYDADVALDHDHVGDHGPAQARAARTRIGDRVGRLRAQQDPQRRRRRSRRTAASDAPRRAPMPNLVPMPLALWSGIYNTLFASRVGAAIILLHPFDARDFADAVKRFELKSTVLAPPMITMLSDDPGITSLAPLRFVRSGTAPLSPSEARRFRDRFGVTVLNSYGQTELGGEIVGWNADDTRRYGDAKLGSVGRPHDGIEVRIVRDDGTDAARNEPGEIWARSPFVMRGYASDARELDTRLDADGFLRTGDIGHLDDDGFLWIDGRVSDAINRGGLKVYPGDVEEVLREDPTRRRRVRGRRRRPPGRRGAVGVDRARAGRHPRRRRARAAVLATGSRRTRCRCGSSPIDELPRNEVGKVLRRVLIDDAAAMVEEDA